MFDSQTNGKINTVAAEDRAIHNWYRFVLSYPPHLVRHYLHKFGANTNSVVLDPFCGTGTTLVECKKLGIPSVGVEANPVTHYASNVKLDLALDPFGLLSHAHEIASAVKEELSAFGLDDNRLLSQDEADKFIQSNQLRQFSNDTLKILLNNSISPIPLHKALVLLDYIEKQKNSPFYHHERLAFINSAVQSFSNLHFGPEVGVGKLKTDALVIEPWLECISIMYQDVLAFSHRQNIPSKVYLSDSRQLGNVIQPNSIDIVITSPPYPNEKDYTRITRLETVLLGFAHDRASLQALKRQLMRSNTRNVYKGDSDDEWVENIHSIQRVAEAIEARRIELNKTSGFEKLYGKVTKLYFGGIARHLADLRTVLRPGAYLAYVVGDQASYLRIMIRTGQLLGEVAQTLGYELIDIDLFRTRLATATKEQLREEVVILQWKG
jgi:hypothetical protein